MLSKPHSACRGHAPDLLAHDIYALVIVVVAGVALVFGEVGGFESHNSTSKHEARLSGVRFVPHLARMSKSGGVFPSPAEFASVDAKAQVGEVMLGLKGSCVTLCFRASAFDGVADLDPVIPTN